MKTLRYAIIGCGRVGAKRLEALRPGQLAVACDLELARAQEFVRHTGHGRAVTDFKKAVCDSNVDGVIVATVHSALAKVAREAISQGKHVLIEKPAGVNSKEIRSLIPLGLRKKVCVRTGFNHRFHPALLKAKKMVDSGVIGNLMFIRGRYGHGGRIGYEKEWRANPKLSGGGELMDQGAHLIDLSRWFMGEFKSVRGKTATYFWNMKVEDNAFAQLETRRGGIAWLHVSWTEWKNMFSFEIYGQKGKIQIEGLGGSYGTETLHYYQMLPGMGPPKAQLWEFPAPDQSWRKEIEAFEEDIRRGRQPDAGLENAAAVMECVEKIYKSSGFKRRRKTSRLNIEIYESTAQAQN